jgi:hypothetical protein
MNAIAPFLLMIAPALAGVAAGWLARGQIKIVRAERLRLLKAQGAALLKARRGRSAGKAQSDNSEAEFSLLA